MLEMKSCNGILLEVGDPITVTGINAPPNSPYTGRRGEVVGLREGTGLVDVRLDGSPQVFNFPAKVLRYRAAEAANA